MLQDSLFWTKIGRIIVRLSERLQVSPEQAFDIFYSSETCTRLHQPEYGLTQFGDLYIVDEIIREMQIKQN